MIGYLHFCLYQSERQVARGHEEIYRRFLGGRLIYTDPKNKGVITLPIADLANPLEGTFDLSRCGDTGQYLCISTGYRKGKNPANANKLEIWFAPRFLIEAELGTTAGHFASIMGGWNEAEVPVGIFWTWGGWDNMEWYDHLTTQDFDQLSNGKSLYEKATPRPQHAARAARPPDALLLSLTYPLTCFHVSFLDSTEDVTQR